MSVHQCNEFRINVPRPTAVKVNKDPLRSAEITSHPPIKDLNSNQETLLWQEIQLCVTFVLLKDA